MRWHKMPRTQPSKPSSKSCIQREERSSQRANLNKNPPRRRSTPLRGVEEKRVWRKPCTAKMDHKNARRKGELVLSVQWEDKSQPLLSSNQSTMSGTKHLHPIVFVAFVVCTLLSFNSSWPSMWNCRSAKVQNITADSPQRGMLSPLSNSPPDVVLIRSMGAASLLILFIRRQIPAPGELQSFFFGLQRFVSSAILSHACREPLGCVTHPIDV